MWKGQPTIYDESWVEKLKNMVERNLTMQHEFVCLSNTDISVCRKIPLEYCLPGWWSKVELFNQSFGDWVLYLDLDVLIMQNIDGMIHRAMSAPQGFMITQGRRPGARLNKEKKLEIRDYQSSVFCYNSTLLQYRDFFKMLTISDIRKYHSDQDYMADKWPRLDTFPNEWITKLEEFSGLPPEQTKIVLCIPEKNHEAVEKYDWIKEVWR
jgi:alpha-N-acetylglucosamine transferase